MEGCWEILAEECDIRLHDPRNCDIVILIVSAIFVTLPFLPRTGRTVGASFPLEARLALSYGSNASVAAGYPSGFQFLIYLFALDFVFTFNAGCSSKGSVTLNELFRQDSCVALQVVDVLREVRQELVLVL